MANWFYKHDGIEHGPVDGTALKQLANSGFLRPDDLIWREGLKEWVVASRTTGLFDAPATTHKARVGEKEGVVGERSTRDPTDQRSGNSPLLARALMLVASAIVGGAVVALLFWIMNVAPQREFSSGDNEIESEAIGSVMPTREGAAGATSRPPSAGVVPPAGSKVLSNGNTPPPAQTKEPEFDRLLFQKSSPAVVKIVSFVAGKVDSQGSGFFVSSDGRVVTNYHVIKNAENAEVLLSNNARFAVQGVMNLSESDDLALLKVEAVDVPFLNLHQGGPSPVGTPVAAIGNPKGLTNTLSTGIVSGLRALDDGLVLIQTTAPISSGSSGGPLLSRDGSVLGVTTSSFIQSQNLNFAVPAERVKSLVASASGLKNLAEALGRPSSPLGMTQTELPRWAQNLPFEGRISVVCSADDSIRPMIESHLKRELRRIPNVVLINEKPQWQISVVALPQEAPNGVLGAYWLSVVVFEYSEHGDPQNFTFPQGRIVKHALVSRGTQVFEDGMKELVAEIDAEIIEPTREMYENFREIAREQKPK